MSHVEYAGGKRCLRDYIAVCLEHTLQPVQFKVKCWSSVTPSMVMVSGNCIGMPAIVSGATTRMVHKRLMSANQNRFGFTAVEGQTVVTKPVVQSRQTVGK